MKKQISSLPGLDNVTVREFRQGRGLVIKIPARGKGRSAVKEQRFDIDLKDATKANEELKKVREFLVNMSLNKQKILMTPEEEQQYVTDYGTGKEKATNPNPDPKPKPPKPPRPGE